MNLVVTGKCDPPPSAVLVKQRSFPMCRISARGKFLFDGDKKFLVKGVTYGAFRPDSEGSEYQNLETIERDFHCMAAHGINCVRVPHTMPPRALLDAAQRHGLRVMVGLSAEQYVGYLVDTAKAPDIEALIRRKVQSVAGHPALLCYAIGNEIPAAMVRWLGRRKVERYLRRIYEVIKNEDSGGLVTYVNYPSTEYLDLPFVDLLSFNVYLESQPRLQAYLARLQNIAGKRPLLMSEIGLDSLRNGEVDQAQSLGWQIRTAFGAGCAGTFIFSWTDEWFRAGAPVYDWEFGLTRRDRSAKPALNAVRQAYCEAPFSSNAEWPRISVVVCTYNGSSTIRDCMEALRRVRYPDFEVIVVDDGSTDETPEIVRRYPFRIIRSANHGLSNARNLGWQAANGEIVAYIDDDAYPDPDWLSYLAVTFQTTTYVGVGGPNIAPADDGPVAECVANSPGGPTHVLLSDHEAEHIPGCNMAFRRSALESVGGFDPQFRVAGDDVDICWRLQARGWKLGFSPAAQVWHHSRNSVRRFWKQQKGYGRAEAFLERAWPEKYNSAGHLTWSGRVYSESVTRILGCASRIYFGEWGTAPFQSLYQGPPRTLQAMCLMPEWYLVNLGLVVLSLLGLLWSPLLVALPVLLFTAGLPLACVWASVTRAQFRSASPLARLRLLTAFLHVTQPLARLYGRCEGGLTLWRRRTPSRRTWPVTRKLSVWTSEWQMPELRLRRIESALRDHRQPVRRGGPYDRWDLYLSGGLLGGARMKMVCEDGNKGHQYARFHLSPTVSAGTVAFVLALTATALAAAVDGAWLVSAILSSAGFLLTRGVLRQCAGAMATFIAAIRPQLAEAVPVPSSAPATLQAAPQSASDTAGATI